MDKKSEKKNNSIKQFPAIILNIKQFQPEKQLVFGIKFQFGI
jgi:hypothetical protein